MPGMDINPFAPTDTSRKKILPFTQTPTAGIKFPFPVDNVARRLRGIKWFSSTQMAVVYSQGITYTVPDPDALVGLMLVLRDDQANILGQFPLYSLLGEVNYEKVTLFCMDVNWQNSYIISTDNTAGLDSTYALVAQIYYE